MTFAQEESTAKFHDMPRAAVSSGAVDFVLPPKKIAEELARLARHPYVGLIAAAEKEILGEQLPDQAKIFQMLRAATGVDFSNYRQTTIRRRISRRMALNKIDRVPEYINFLKQNGGEVQKLYDDLLINVTGFFRDPETFKSLKSIVFPSLLKNRTADSPVRVWVPGCSTGEEVYSIAIALFECLGETGGNPPIQIFATDISEPAIERARAGIYLENAVADLSPERLRRFFVSVETGYQISKSIRDVCVFARQNLAADPPFSNLDVLSCRNVLIYLEPVLQKRIVPLFYYALKPTGYLVLGSAETLAASDLFAPVDKSVRIFIKKPGALRPIFDFASPVLAPMDGERAAPTPTEHNRFLELQKEADRIVMSHYGPPGVIVNEGLDVVQFRGRTSRFLEAPAGTPSLNVLKMAREGLLVELRDSIAAARKTGARVVKENVRVRTNKEFHSIRLEVDPIRQEKGGARHFLILFDEEPHSAPDKAHSTAPPRTSAAARATEEQAIATLEQELTATKEYLQSIIEEQEASNEELKSANEEILSSNEELQSTNEELETAKEELQSANEELTTVNEELQNRNAELGRLTNDLTNLFGALAAPIVMLGPAGEIRRFTPPAEKLFNLIPTDVGRPIRDIRPNIDAPNLADMVLKAVDTVQFSEREVRDKEGRWYSLRIHPYRTLDNRIDGAVISLFDISLIKKTLDEANLAREYAQALVWMVGESLLVLDRDLKIRTANRAFSETFKVPAGEIIGKSLFDIGGEWGGSSTIVREKLGEVVADNKPFDGLEFEVEFDHVGRKLFKASARQILFVGDTRPSALLSLEDLTESRRAKEDIRSAEARYRRLFETAREGIWMFDAKSGEILDVNPFLVELLEYPRSELIGKRVWELPVQADPESVRRRSTALRQTGYSYEPELPLRTRTGRTVLVEAISTVHLGRDRLIAQANLRDITERKSLEAELRQSQKLESIGRLAGGIAHDFNNILNIIAAYSAILARGAAEPKQAQSTEAIDKAVSRGAALVRQLLTFARKGEVKFQAVNLNSVVREVSQMVSETFPKNVRIVTALETNLPRILADASQLHQAILNLCVNARDAMADGGQLRIATQVIDGGGGDDSLEQRYVRLSISDEGKGMDEETRSRLFEPFFTTKATGEGTGLGLAVVYGIVQSHGGLIDVESAVGKGTTFHLSFPLDGAGEKKPVPEQARSATDASGEDQASQASGGGTVLFVEDEKTIADSAAGLMEAAGYRVLRASDGYEALDVHARNHEKIDVAVIDLIL
ncbi:MAG TPA: CheR family methyltransferase, partial [Thermoanaerobaculia bacterium]|nr:CheR family methyltransferase [Thermoanaerobaculia bacterium]